jgi:site-specific DNA-cytosine methylase
VGGVTLSLERAGFHVLAAIDSNHEAIATLRANLPGVAHALKRDLTRFPPEDLATLLTPHCAFPTPPSVDVIVGGPNHVRRQLWRDP